jgi:quercetin dioxygenase-like cupin family protein
MTMLVGISEQHDDGLPGSAPPCSGAAARALHPAGAARRSPLSTEVLADIATGLASVVDPGESIRPAAGRRRAGIQAPPDEVVRERLLATAGYDAWLVTWPPGAVLEEHDHDGSVGVVHVVSGTLVEEARGLEPDAAIERRQLPTGSCTAFGVDARHRLENVAGVALTVQVFSPPLGGG